MACYGDIYISTVFVSLALTVGSAVLAEVYRCFLPHNLGQHIKSANIARFKTFSYLHPHISLSHLVS